MPPAGTYRASYDLSDSRRSPRDQSPPRYNDRNDRNERNERDEYRTGSHTTERRRSIPDLRSDLRANNNAFNSNRDAFRDSMGRDSSRDFPPRDPPRGPKSLIEPPTGPRASASNYSDYRADRNEYGFRGGDYRGDRGRGRGRGWRDDSRERGRDLLDRPPFRRDRDDRGSTHFRDEPSRERWGRETYPRGRRPSSPLGRGRSPPYGPRDNRDAPPNIEVDRARRGSRDGPLSGGSPSSDGAPFTRGFGRVLRGGRGRGRSGYYDDHRRSRSPESGWSRRTQPSATPPPQVPAFGSNLPVAATAASISIPTAPKAQRRADGRHRLELVSGLEVAKQESQDTATSVKKELVDNILRLSPKGQSGDSIQSSLPSQVSPEPGKIEQSQDIPVQDSQTERAVGPPPKRKGWHITGARPQKPIVSDVSDIEDSGDDLPDNYFEDEISRINQAIEVLERIPVVGPREDPNAPFMRPLIAVNITAKFAKAKALATRVFSHPKGLPQPKLDDKLIEPSVDILTLGAAILPEQKRQAQKSEVVKTSSSGTAIDDPKQFPQPPIDETLAKRSAKIAAHQQAILPEQNTQAQHSKTGDRSSSGPVQEATSTDKLPDSSTKKQDRSITPVKDLEPSSKSSIQNTSVPQNLHPTGRSNEVGDDKTVPELSEEFPPSLQEAESTSLTIRDAQKDHDAPKSESNDAQLKLSFEAPASGPDYGKEGHEGHDTENSAEGKVVEPSYDSREGMFEKFDGFVPSSTRLTHHKATSPSTLIPTEGPKSDTRQDTETTAPSTSSLALNSTKVLATAPASIVSVPTTVVAQEKVAVGTVQLPDPRVSNNETSPSLTNDADDTDNPLELIERTRAQMKTPDINTLPQFDCLPFEQDPIYKEDLNRLLNDTTTHDHIKQSITDAELKKKKEVAVAVKEYKQLEKKYQEFVASDDPLAVKSREKFTKARAKAAVEAASLSAASAPTNGARAESGQRRTGRWATEHDFERVLRESEQEAKETKDREQRKHAARANAKEACIPDMSWDEEEWNRTMYQDTTNLVPPDRSLAVLEYGEWNSEFTEEECRLFEEAYLEHPKQFSKIAEALPNRDYKECITHYYLVKHSSNLKEKLKKQPKKRKTRAKPAGKNPKSNALIENLGIIAPHDAEDGQEAENGERTRRPKRAAAPTWPIEAPASEGDIASPAPAPSRKAAANAKGEGKTEAPPPKRKTKAAREKAPKQAKNNQLLAAAPSAPAARQPESPAPSLPPQDWKNRRELPANPRPSSRMDIDPQPVQHQAIFPATAFSTVEKHSPAAPVNMDAVPQYNPPERAERVERVERPDRTVRFESVPPASNVFEPQPDRRSVQQTSSYWSVPEQQDFPALLRHFGTDWHGIAKFMTSKTHIMVYTNLFKQWLTVPSDSNKSRLVANIQTQVKNYYQRQVNTGGMRDWEEFTREADARKERGEMPPELPPPPIMPKKRLDLPPGALPRSGSAMDIDDYASSPQPKLPTQASPPQPSLSSRFPTLAQAGPVPHIQPGNIASPALIRHNPPQPIQQAAPPVQIAQQPTRRAPTMGFFTQSEPRESRDMTRDTRPLMQAHGSNTVVSERASEVAREADLERQKAEDTIRKNYPQGEQHQVQQQQQSMQREQSLQQQALQQQASPFHQQQAQQVQQQPQLHAPQVSQAQQQHALQQQAIEQQNMPQQNIHPQHRQRERPVSLKQEAETPDIRQYEQYAPPPRTQSSNIAPIRTELPKATPSAHLEQRRTTAPPQQQYQSRNHPASRNFPSESGSPAGLRDIKSISSPVVPRPPMSAPPITQEQYSAPTSAGIHNPQPQRHSRLPLSVPQVAPVSMHSTPQPAPITRPPDTVRKTSSIMSLLNDEPSEPRPTPPKRVSDVSASMLQPSRTPPPPQHSLQRGYQIHPSQVSQQGGQMQQQMSSQAPARQQPQPILAGRLPQSTHEYSQPNPHANPHPIHQHSSSIGSHTRSYTPNSFDQGPYSAGQHQANSQQLYTQSQPTAGMNAQQPALRREPSMGEIHGVTNGYSRASAPSQPRLQESPYSKPTPPPSQRELLRQPAGSPLDMGPTSAEQRDLYRQPQPSYLMAHHQSSGVSSPQPGNYHPQSYQQPPSNHQRFGLGQNHPHVASPPPTQFSGQRPQRSRHNSFDGHNPMRTSAPGPTPQTYTQTPPYQPTPPARPLHMQYQPQHPNHGFDGSYEQRLQEEAHYRRMEEQRRRDEHQRLDDSRR